MEDRDYIILEGLTFRGGAISTSEDTDYNMYRDNTFYAYDKGDVGRFYVSGSYNQIRDCEFSVAWMSSIHENGHRNSVVNNYFHDICYRPAAQSLVAQGTEFFFSRNTVRKYARNVFDGFSIRGEYSYNLFKDGGRLTYDTGVFDSDGGNGNSSQCIIHHNVFRNTDSRGYHSVFYGKNNNAVIHHNIIYDWLSKHGTAFVVSPLEPIFGSFITTRLSATSRRVEGRGPPAPAI